MRKLLLIIILLIAGISLGADIIIRPEFNFGLISAPEYNLDLRYSSSLKRIYVIAEFTLDKKTLPKTTYHSFMLTRDAHLEQICISDKICGTILASDLVPEHFVPDFPVPALLDSTSNAICYSFNLAPLKSSKEPIRFRMVYWLDVQDVNWESTGQGSYALNSDSLWYPRNLIGPSTLNIRITTSDKYQVRIGEILNYSDNDGIRTHEGSFPDEPNKYFELKIIRMLN